ncbi:hypothetical protein HDR61_04535 [bacterium]|nr:hypothetical protein [bacterium]
MDKDKMKKAYNNACKLVIFAAAIAGGASIGSQIAKYYEKKHEAKVKIANLTLQNDSIHYAANYEISGLFLSLKCGESWDDLSKYSKEGADARRARGAARYNNIVHQIDSIEKDAKHKIALNNAQIEQLARENNIKSR